MFILGKCNFMTTSAEGQRTAVVICRNNATIGNKSERPAFAEILGYRWLSSKVLMAVVLLKGLYVCY